MNVIISCYLDKSTCGNFVLDDDEECDEGPASIALNKPCCTENCRFKHGYNCRYFSYNSEYPKPFLIMPYDNINNIIIVMIAVFYVVLVATLLQQL